MRQVFDVPQRLRKPDVQHYRQANDLRACFKVGGGGAFCHPAKLGERLVGLNELSSDIAVDAVMIRAAGAGDIPDLLWLVNEAGAGVPLAA